MENRYRKNYLEKNRLKRFRTESGRSYTRQEKLIWVLSTLFFLSIVFLKSMVFSWIFNWTFSVFNYGLGITTLYLFSFIILSMLLFYLTNSKNRSELNSKESKALGMRLEFFVMGVFTLIVFEVVFIACGAFSMLLNYIASFFDANFSCNPVWIFIVAFISLLIFSTDWDNLFTKSSRKFQSKAMQYEEQCRWLDSYIDYDSYHENYDDYD